MTDLNDLVNREIQERAADLVALTLQKVAEHNAKHLIPTSSASNVARRLAEAGLLFSTERGAPFRIFTEDEEPPLGERIDMKAAKTGEHFTWTGKRWHYRDESDPQLHEAWPPDVKGPYFEVPRG